MSTLVTEDVFDFFDGRPVRRFTLENGNIILQIINYGATITSIKIGGVDVALGFDNMAGYLGEKVRNPYLGAIVGRVANRISGGTFILDGNKYSLEKNNGTNALHGGLKGFDKAMWNAVINNDGSVVFSHLSPDNDEGYPGDVLVNVRYSLKNDGSVQINFNAMVSKATPLNLTNHVYFNLGGHSSGKQGLNEHTVRMACDSYTPVTDKLIPTGKIETVGGTVFDMRFPIRLEDVLRNCPGGDNNGFDHNFVVSGDRDLNIVCRVSHPQTNIWLECFTDQPGCQFYTGNFLPQNDSLLGKAGATYEKHGGFCLETQKFPDSINQNDFPCSVVRPGEIYKHTVIYKFGIGN